MKVIDPDTDKIDDAILNIMENGICAHCGAIGLNKVVSTIKAGFEEEGYSPSVTNNTILVYQRQKKDLGRLTPLAKVNVESRNINFEWNGGIKEEKLKPLFIIGITLKSFYSNFGELNEAYIDIEINKSIFIFPLIEDVIN